MLRGEILELRGRSPRTCSECCNPGNRFNAVPAGITLTNGRLLCQIAPDDALATVGALRFALASQREQIDVSKSRGDRT
ncbi:hypothetical protein BraRD5C2_28490 [Bradyrhizobium sp. RD5-C2]|nr:hypothetical protein BraRD5C2_28490 [Bradyrhizobium sp. RD5-C2]